MNEEIETTFVTTEGTRLTIAEMDDGAWLHLQFGRASAHTPLTRGEVEQLLAGLQAILAKGAA
jgi:hypothetical protein